MNLTALHATALKLLIDPKYHGREVTFTDRSSNTYTVDVIWNFAEYAVKLDVTEGSPLGAKNSIYVDKDSLNTLGITPEDGWTVTGSPNDYEDEKTYIMQIPKQDYQLPGMIIFITPYTEGVTQKAFPTV